LSSGSHILHVLSILPSLTENYAITGDSDYRTELSIHVKEYQKDMNNLLSNVSKINSVDNVIFNDLSSRLVDIQNGFSSLNSTIISVGLAFGDNHTSNMTVIQ
jgi:hypothetical protein